MKNLLVSIFSILLLSAPIFSQIWYGDEDEGGYVEQVTVRVLDEMGRPVEGVEVNITWEITRARGSATTKTLSTNATGRVEFTLTNLEFDPDDMNKEYVVRARYGDTQQTQTFVAVNGEVERTMVMPLHTVVFRVRDKDYRGLEGIKIVVDGKYIATTSQRGIAILTLDEGAHTAEPQYRDLDQATQFVVDGDTNVEIMLTLYQLFVRIIDDEGNPLVAQVHVGSQTKTSSADGWANFSDITSSQVDVHSTYGRYRKTLRADIERSDVLQIVFDSRPPTIEDVSVQYLQNSIQIRAVIRDRGDYASGLNDQDSSVVLFYMGPDGMQRSLPMYLVGYGLYEGLIPVEPGQDAIRYTVQATDADGNSATNTDTFVVPAADPTGFGEAEGQPPARIVEEQFSFNWTVIPLVAIAGVVVALIGYWFYNSKKLPSEEEEPKNPQAATREYDYNQKDMPNLEVVPKKDSGPKPPQVPK